MKRLLLVVSLLALLPSNGFLSANLKQENDSKPISEIAEYYAKQFIDAEESIDCISDDVKCIAQSRKIAIQEMKQRIGADFVNVEYTYKIEAHSLVNYGSYLVCSKCGQVVVFSKKGAAER